MNSAPRVRAVLAAIILLLGATPLAAQRLDTLRTSPERTAFRQTTRYDDVIAFMEATAAASPRIHLTTFGYTHEGRPLPLAVVGNVDDASPEAVLRSGHTRVYLQGNIHAGEVEGKESLLKLLRELAQGRHGGVLDSLVLLIAPIYNADGNERVLLTNRPAQHGPVGGMGQRPNAQGHDLNRDHMKLDAPEARSLALLLQRYDPHVGVDLHTTNGTRHAYHLTYSPPLHPSTDSSIVRLLRGRWLPEMTRNIRQKHGWDYYYYGNLQGQGDARGWYTFDHRPRFNNNYLGLRNRIAILSEAYSYLPFEERIQATSWFVEEILDFARRNATEIRTTVERVDAAPIMGRTLALRAEYERSDSVDILMGDVIEERNPYSGATMLRRTDASRVERMPEFGTFVPSVTERVPAAYIIPPAAPRAAQGGFGRPDDPVGDLVDRLHAHGVRTATLEAPRSVQAERFRIDGMQVAEREFQGHRERTIEGVWEAAAAVDLPVGTVIVHMDQPLARLTFHLLEPRADDGFANWALLDRLLEDVTHYPILRAHGPIR
jgi:hypothetical protein